MFCASLNLRPTWRTSEHQRVKSRDSLVIAFDLNIEKVLQQKAGGYTLQHCCVHLGWMFGCLGFPVMTVQETAGAVTNVTTLKYHCASHEYSCLVARHFFWQLVLVTELAWHCIHGVTVFWSGNKDSATLYLCSFACIVYDIRQSYNTTGVPRDTAFLTVVRVVTQLLAWHRVSRYILLPPISLAASVSRK